MPSIVVNCFGGLPATMYQSMLSVDVDTDAERIAVFNRYTLELLINYRPATAIFKTITPIGYATSNDLIVMIIDDNRVYNAKAIDGVKTEIIDGLITSIR